MVLVTMAGYCEAPSRKMLAEVVGAHVGLAEAVDSKAPVV
jgi:hypothetical protein